MASIIFYAYILHSYNKKYDDTIKETEEYKMLNSRDSHFSLEITSQNKKINEINDCKTIFAAHRAQRATNSTQQQPLMAHNIS
jgi:hypothetical protein